MSFPPSSTALEKNQQNELLHQSNSNAFGSPKLSSIPAEHSTDDVQ